MISSSMFLYEHLAFFVFHKPQNILAKKIRNCQTKAVKADMIHHPQTYTWLEKINPFSLSLDDMTFTPMTFFHMTKNGTMMITAMTYTAQILMMIAMMMHQFFLLMYTKTAEYIPADTPQPMDLQRVLPSLFQLAWSRSILYCAMQMLVITLILTPQTMSI